REKGNFLPVLSARYLQLSSVSRCCCWPCVVTFPSRPDLFLVFPRFVPRFCSHFLPDSLPNLPDFPPHDGAQQKGRRTAFTFPRSKIREKSRYEEKTSHLKKTHSIANY